jgi:hypothetical protein
VVDLLTAPQNVMAATYPDIFKAAIPYSGVSAGCFASAANGVAAWNSTCAQGNSIATPQAWANVVKNMYPGYTGARPKMQVYHGSADTTLRPQNYQETMKQWVGLYLNVRRYLILITNRLAFSATTTTSPRAPRTTTLRADTLAPSTALTFKVSTLRVSATPSPFGVPTI